ncbi:hypothetical protein [Roseomonas chloroacetimidivorans]|uniref:hypothetical protein n=1 Tax=Roseomonas chloroacetimidivorans TaxID=1766656 RepID=UPI003C73FDD4
MLSYKVLLVHVERHSSSEARILMAADLADRFEATLIGLAADPIASAEELQAAGRSFHAISSRAARHREWRAFAAPLTAALAREARAADLLVLGFRLGELPGPLDATAGPAGRPVLLVPERTCVLDASRILIAWRDTLQARRAVATALPIMRLAEQVEILAVHGTTPSGDGAGEGLSDVAVYLSRHDVRAEIVRQAPADARRANHITLAAQELGADLIVAGASVVPGIIAAQRSDAAQSRGSQLQQCWLLSH